MRRYLAFAGSSFYPVGGWFDFVGSFDTVDEARTVAKKKSDWWHVVDAETREIVVAEESGDQGVVGRPKKR